MVRKQKHARRSGKADVPHALDDDALADAAQRALANSRHKDAIELCKELCKRTPNVENRSRLASAYAGRARDLAAKGMLKEAAAVWRNRADLCGEPLMEGPYPEWLRRIGDMKPLLQAYRACLCDEGMRAELATIEATLAIHVLTASEATLAELPVDSPLMSGRLQVRAALKAYAESDPDLEDALKAIPFRSPYRDLARILKVMVRMERDPAAVEELARISADSPFARLAAVAKTAVLPIECWLTAVRTLQGADRVLALEFKNIPDSQRTLVDEFLRLGERPAPGVLFDWILRQRHRVSQAGLESLCRALLPLAPDRIRVYRQAIGGLTDAEAERLLALHAESRPELSSALRHWLSALELYRREGAESSRLNAAMILRHLAELAPAAADGGMHRDAITWLRQSLDFDPDDLETVLRLLPEYRLRGDLKSARSLLDAALAKFPSNAQVLLEAVEVALAGNAFKKAAGYARRVLELDPINPRVRSLLGHAHLAHARKQIKAGKPDAACRELMQASEWLRAPADQTAVKRLQGIVDIEAGREAEGRQRLAEAMAESGCALLGYFQMAMEMARLGREPVKTLRTLGFRVPKAVAAGEVMALVKALEHFKGQQELLRKVMAPLQSSLLAAAKQMMPETDRLLICETFLRMQLFQLVYAYAEAAPRQGSSNAVFVYHRINARYGQRPWSIPDRDYHELTRARDRAEDAGDRRTVARIEQLLVPPAPALDIDDGPLFGEEPGLEDPMTPEDAMNFRKVLGTLGPDALLDMAVEVLGKKMFKQLEATVGKDQLLPLLIDILGTSAGNVPPPLTPGRPPKPAGKPAAGDQRGDSVQGDLFDD